MLRQECATTPSQRIDREEICPAGVPDASIIGHGVAWQEYGALRLLRPTLAEATTTLTRAADYIKNYWIIGLLDY